MLGLATLPLVGFVFLAFTVEAALGFGATIVTVTLGALVAPVEVILPAFVPVNVVLSLRLVLKFQGQVRWDLLLKRVLPLMAIGMPLGIFAFAELDSALLVKVFGGFVIALALLELLVRRASTPPARGGLGGPFPVALLVLGGVVHGAFGTGGPMVVYVCGRLLPLKGEFRATLSALWLVLNSILVVSHVAGGRWTSETPLLTAALVPALLVGLVLGQALHDRIPADRFRRVVFVMLALAGAVLVLR
ncbi:MAG: sulfite exporter TauE/SafE family protein [Deltaproteobacteria bacterium]|nr:sulfite exporter TauE/SafE family protein [Deltaproteobacteria bacterium]